jgi:hypothetical protein
MQWRTGLELIDKKMQPFINFYQEAMPLFMLHTFAIPTDCAPCPGKKIAVVGL